MKLTDFDYTLPDHLIARYPLPQRSASRLLVLNRVTGDIQHHTFSDLAELLNPHDLLVANDTRVMPARLHLHKQTGGKLEVLIERVLDDKRVLAHIRNGGSLKPGAQLFMDHRAVFQFIARRGDLFELINLAQQPVATVIEQIGEMPLPPYFARAPEASDLERYQTVYAKTLGSVAAPTAGLHFDDVVLQRLAMKDITMTHVTLHVGAGTFAPVRVEDITQHRMHAELIEVPAKVCQRIHEAHTRGHRVVAVGTTAARSLESASLSGTIAPFAGETDIFMYPGFQFQCMDALITNFHLPRSSLLMLVAAFAGYESIMHAYHQAIEMGYRFYSYGDAMLIL